MQGADPGDLKLRFGSAVVAERAGCGSGEYG